MGAKSCLMSLLLLTLASFGISHAYEYTESGYVDEPWSGWWWPRYHPDAGQCPYQHHMWEGPNIQGGEPGPIYDLDTKYFWKPGSERTEAQFWEHDSHRVTNPNLMWAGHCAGVSCAQVMEPEPPTDCGALSQEDLEGLLGETWMDCEADAFGDGSTPIKPSDMWFALRYCLGDGGAEHRPFVTDFYTDGPTSTEDIEWNYPVHAYDIQFDVNEQISPCFAWGIMTLDYEDHVYGLRFAPRQAWYRFWCYVYPTPSGWSPVAHTGEWGECHGPGDPPITTAPQNALLPQRRMEERRTRNPYIDYDSIRRVIDHKTIILDDAYRDSTEPVDPPDGLWEERPGFAGGCWAVQAPPETPVYHMHWYPPLFIAGQWSVYAYKTPPVAGDDLNDQANVWIMPYGHWSWDQSAEPYGDWRLLGTCYIDPETLWYVCVDNSWWSPSNCHTYYDAVKLEYVEEGKDGGTGSPMVKLGGLAQRIRVWPSPARGKAQISYALSKASPVVIVVYDVTGRVVLRADQGIRRAGPQTATISVAGLPTGTYMARVSVNGVNSTCRFVVCR